MHMCANLLQSCPTLCVSVDHGPPGSSAHGTLQARILEWVAMPSSGESSQPRDQTHVFCVSCMGRWGLYPKCHLGNPFYTQQCIYVNATHPIHLTLPSSFCGNMSSLYICISILKISILRSYQGNRPYLNKLILETVVPATFNQCTCQTFTGVFYLESAHFQQ